MVDKDLTTALMGNVLGFRWLLILTAVVNVSINFGKRRQKALEHVSMRELRAYHSEGHFPAGSMGPKVEAALRFLEGGGDRVIISHLDSAEAALRGECGTHVVACDYG